MLNVGQKVSLFSFKMVGYIELRSTAGCFLSMLLTFMCIFSCCVGPFVHDTARLFAYWAFRSIAKSADAEQEARVFLDVAL